jgi:hypothetical protein
MSIAFLREFAPTGERSTSNYDAVTEHLQIEADRPEGMLLHCAGFAEDGTFRMFDIWPAKSSSTLHRRAPGARHPRGCGRHRGAAGSRRAL